MPRVLNFDFLANVPRLPTSTEVTLQAELGWNPQSLHALGQRAKHHLTQARQAILQNGFARFSTAEFPPGGASVANRRAILGSLPRRPRVISPGVRRDVVLISTIEHTSILRHVSEELKELQYTVAFINCRVDGVLDVEHLETLLTTYDQRVALVSVMLVNNETGILQPLHAVLQATRRFTPSALVHSDITQGVEQFWSSHSSAAAVPDLVTFSGYKLGGPHVGVLLSLKALVQADYTGTPDVAAIHAISAILQNKYTCWQERPAGQEANNEVASGMISALKQQLEGSDISWQVLSTAAACLPNVVTCVFPGFQAKMIQQSLSAAGICIGTGSACQSNSSSSGSHVLSAMGFVQEATFGLVRLSWDPETTVVADAVHVAKCLGDSLLHMHPLVKNRTGVANKATSASSTKHTRVVAPNATTAEVLHRFEVHLARQQATTPETSTERVPSEQKLHLGLSEAYLKGGNRCRFVQHLVNDVRHRLKHLVSERAGGSWSVRNMQQYIDVQPTDAVAVELLPQAEEVMRLVPGLATVVPVWYTRGVRRLADLMPVITQVFERAVQTNLINYDTSSFAVRTKVTGARQFDTFNSQDINVILGCHLSKHFPNVPIQLTRPRIELQVVVRADAGGVVEMSTEKRSGLAGLPLKSEDAVAVILHPGNVLRALYGAILLSTRGVSLVCYHVDGEHLEQFQQLVQLINPYVKYVKVPSTDNIVAMLPLIQERLVFCENHVEDAVRYLEQLKSWCKQATAQKSISAISLHNSAAEIESYLRLILGDRAYPADACASVLPPDSDVIQTGMISMLSGGIDSPVSTAIAARYCLARSQPFKMIHFSSNINKIEAIQCMRDRVAPGCELVVVDFLRLQDALTAACPESYRVMLFKVFMVQIANRVAQQHRIGCVVMGNSLGQVASQTCENLFVTEYFSELPMFLPLLGLPKSEIIEQARTFDTFDASISGGSTDCCVLYLPNHPTLRARAETIRPYLDKFAHFMDLVTVHSF